MQGRSTNPQLSAKSAFKQSSFGRNVAQDEELFERTVCVRACRYRSSWHDSVALRYVSYRRQYTNVSRLVRQLAWLIYHWARS